MNTAGIPVYQLYASIFQALMTQETLTAVGGTQGSAQESNTDNVSTYFKMSEGDKQQTNKKYGLEYTA